MKIILDVAEDVPLYLAMQGVQHVINKGRIRQSGRAYDHSILKTSDGGLLIIAVTANQKSDNFKIYWERKGGQVEEVSGTAL